MKKGVGAPLPRLEDDRLMRGKSQFVGDIKLVGMKEVAFVRSPVAHARLTGITIPDAYKGQVFQASDLVGVKHIRAVSGLPGFKISEQPPLAVEKLRFVGEPVAACVADSRAEAEDIAATIDVQFEPLPVNAAMLEARAPGAPTVNDHW